jgi:hypothetical protein
MIAMIDGAWVRRIAPFRRYFVAEALLLRNNESLIFIAPQKKN